MSCSQEPAPPHPAPPLPSHASYFVLSTPHRISLYRAPAHPVQTQPNLTCPDQTLTMPYHTGTLPFTEQGSSDDLRTYANILQGKISYPEGSDVDNFGKDVIDGFLQARLPHAQTRPCIDVFFCNRCCISSSHPSPSLSAVAVLLPSCLITFLHLSPSRASLAPTSPGQPLPAPLPHCIASSLPRTAGKGAAAVGPPSARSRGRI